MLMATKLMAFLETLYHFSVTIQGALGIAPPLGKIIKPKLSKIGKFYFYYLNTNNNAIFNAILIVF